MKKLGILISILFFTGSELVAQDYLFRVIISKGNNELQYSQTGNEPLKTGSLLKEGAVLNVSENGYVALLSKSGATLEVKSENPRNYTLQELSDLLEVKDSGLLEKYTSYVISKMAPEEREKNRKAYASVTGAVERNFGSIQAFMKRSSVLYGLTAIVRWVPRESAEYNIEILNLYSDVLFTYATTENVFTIDFSNPKLTELDMIIVSISTDDGISGEYSITKVTQDRSIEFEKEMNELKAALSKDSAFDYLVLAEFYEQNNLILDASTCYEKALVLEPDIQYFKDVYAEFLMRNDFGNVVQ